MSSTLAIALVTIGAIIILSLAGYAVYLLLKLKKRTQAMELAKREEAQKLEEIQQKAQERIDYIELSLGVLGSSLKDKQITTAEASIRICGLLDFLALEPQQYDALKPFFDVRDALSHIPQLSDFKALSKDQRLAYHEEIERIEKAHESSISEATDKLMALYPVKSDVNEPIFYTPAQ